MSENLGARKADEVTVDVTSLTNADNEPLSTWTGESDIDVADNAAVVGHDDKEYHAKVDDQNDRVLVIATGSGATTAGADPGIGTDVGSITLRLEGRR